MFILLLWRCVKILSSVLFPSTCFWFIQTADIMNIRGHREHCAPSRLSKTHSSPVSPRNKVSVCPFYSPLPLQTNLSDYSEFSFVGGGGNDEHGPFSAVPRINVAQSLCKCIQMHSQPRGPSSLLGGSGGFSPCCRLAG